MFHFCLSIVRCLKAIICIVIAVILFTSYPSAALAQQRGFWEIASEQIQTLFGQRKQAKAPVIGRVRGGAGRGRCPELIPLNLPSGKYEIPLTAFVPVIREKSSTLNYVWGQTVEQYPSFWFYIPYRFNELEIRQGKFVLLNQDRSIVAGPIRVDIPREPSIAKFSLPSSVEGLKDNQEYNWYFSIICNELKPSRNPGVTAWIEKVELPILPPQNYQYYAKQGIWYDAVNRFILSHKQTLSQQKEGIELIKFSLKNANAIEKPYQENEGNFEKNLNLIATEIANFPIEELKPSSNSDDATPNLR